ncbi:hypothetical protein PT974_11964 [Cladobotryum mycophilum]|uniref:N-acetyltransferase domain-containing protein n=1 Tax=Cladobotryum mycophilum TaxID=491253 RepID=A0ABR0S7S8_9HYPO
MTFEIITPSEGDAPTIAAIHIRAMESNLLLHAQFPTQEGLDFLHRWLVQETVEHIKDKNKGVLIARDAGSGEVAGFVRWFVQRPGVENDELPDELPEFIRPQYLIPYVELTEKTRTGVIGDASYYHPTYICTDPRFGGKGAGSLLIRKVQELAAAEKLPVVIEATMNAVTFYEKHGFETKDELSLMLPPRGSDKPTVLYEERCMIWTPPS